MLRDESFFDEVEDAGHGSYYITELTDRMINEAGALASNLGQLAPVVVTINQGESDRYWQLYEQQCLSLGMRQGDIKPTALETRFDWDEALIQSSGTVNPCVHARP